ncbi:MAG: helix-turn-helix transcriptional regulator [Collimonas sp.]|uniref:helix-turn-helix domain-containing protein n=1 Tax=Collimonas sp. TaxID=1963772 RepID=UPI003266AFE3
MEFNNIGARLHEERNRLGFTQQELTQRIGITQNMWSKYERGQAVPGGDVLAALLAIGGDVLYVLSGQHTDNPVSAEEKELLSIFRKLDLRGKVNLLGMADVVGKTPTEMAKPTPSTRVGSMQFHKGVKVGQHIVGDITAPQTINVGGGKRAKKPKKNLEQ